MTLTFGIPQAIFLEAVLSFIGVGIQPPQSTWGQMVNSGYENIYVNMPPFGLGRVGTLGPATGGMQTAAARLRADVEAVAEGARYE